MTKDQLARLARHRKVQQTLTTYATAVAAVPALTRLAAQFGQQLALLDGAATQRGVTSQGATQRKNTASAALIARLVKAANALYLLYKAENNLEEAAKMHRHPTDYRNMSEQVLATEAADLSQRATARAQSLADYNLPAADVQTLAADATAFGHLLSSPQLAIDAAKIKGATTRATLRNLNRFLKDELRAGIELLRDSHPAAYAALREAMQVDDKRSRRPAASKAKSAGGASLHLAALVETMPAATAAASASVASAPAAAAPGLQAAFVQVPGPPVWLVLTVNTVCNWDFSFAPGPAASQPPRQPPRRVILFASDPAMLVGTSSTWLLQVVNVDANEQSYQGSVQLAQGNTADATPPVYSEDIPLDTLPAAPSNPALITGTVSFYAA